MPLLSRSSVGRAEELRSDVDALVSGWGEAHVLEVDPRGRVRVDGTRLLLRDATEFGREPIRGAVFLGIREGRHVWAMRASELVGELADLRLLGSELGDEDAGLVTGAVAILNWHDSARFSAYDGAPSEPSVSGWSRISTSTGHEEFPRTDPAVICLVHDGGDRVLLARQPSWPRRRFSILAGFVEAGESLETCVMREIKEEVGLDVEDVRYLGSQPWPFPRSVMIGYAAVGDPEAPLVFADGEIAEAHWFTRDEVRAALEAGDWTSTADARLLLPGSISIARGILESWSAAG
ncbi:NAD(+) diphosphatase [Rhodococcus sp. NPDC058521]|uniref:NAD(+) diphosphatase n=1 Tax=Rhodococcus sp. NPDC058521 TaxID=3346536 RepID=UPI0036662873